MATRINVSSLTGLIAANRELRRYFAFLERLARSDAEAKTRAAASGNPSPTPE